MVSSEPNPYRSYRGLTGVNCHGKVFDAASGDLKWLHKSISDLCLRRSILPLSGGMGVGTKGGSCVVVAQHTGDGLHVYAVLKCQGGESMAEVVERAT